MEDDGTQAQGQRSKERQEEVGDRRPVNDYSATSVGFASLPQQDWHSVVSRVLASLNGSVAALGVHILGLVLHSAMQSGTNVRLQLHVWFGDSPRLNPLLKGDLLPLPVVLSDVELEVLAEVFAGRNLPILTHDSDSLGSRCWLQCIVFTLNSMWAALRSVTFSDKHQRPWPGLQQDAPPQANQVEALRVLQGYVTDFLSDADVNPMAMVSKHWEDELRRKRIDYCGHMVPQSVAVTWKQIEPALPPEDCAARVVALSLAEGSMFELLRHPDSVLLPHDQWPADFTNTKVRVASDEDWGLICQGFFKRRMVRPLSRDEFLRDTGGVPLGSGVMGLSTENFTEDDLAILRTVFNLPPSNVLHRVIEGDVATLPYQGILQGLVYDDPSLLHWFSDDMVASFFCFSVSPAWAPLFALEREAPGWAVGSSEPSVPIGLIIVPPGWLSANGVIQYLHRRLVAKASVLPPSLELRKDRPRPTDEDFLSTSLYSVYVDNLDSGKSERRGCSEPVEAWFLSAKSTGQRFGVVYHTGAKSQAFATD